MLLDNELILCYTLVKVVRGEMMNRDNNDPNDELGKYRNNTNLYDKYENSVDNPFFEDSDDIEVLTLEEDKEAKEKLTGILTSEERKIKEKNGFDRKTVLIIVLIAAILGVGYATFAQALAYDGVVSSSSKDGVWDIGFIKMIQKEKKGKASEISPPSFSKHEATFNVSLIEPGDEITYELTIKNSGNLNAEVSSINLVPENSSDDVILYYVSGLSVGDRLDAGRTTDMTVTAKYSSTHGSRLASKTMQVVINYKQRK